MHMRSWSACADTGGFNLNVITFLDAVFVSDPVSISLDLVNARIYWAEATDSRIRRADLTGANVLTVLEPPLLFDPLSLSVDPTPSSGLPPTPVPGICLPFSFALMAVSIFCRL